MDPFYKDVLKKFLLLVACLAACRVTGGYFTILIALGGFWAAVTNRHAWALLSFVFLQLVVFINSSIVGLTGTAFIAAKLGLFVVALGMAFRGMHMRHQDKLPLGGLYAYLLFAVVCSFDGWCPIISEFKIVNCFFFLLSVQVATSNLRAEMRDLMILRAGLFAFSAFILVGSLVVYPFPSIGYSMMVNKTLMYDPTMSSGEALARIMAARGMMLFSGVLNHSQTLASIGVAAFSWVLCDMLFVEKRIRKIHLAIIATAPVVMYMTRSRTSLLGLAAIGLIIFVYAIPKARLAAAVRSRLTGLVLAFLAILFVGAIAAEISTHAISRWVRKTDDTADSRRLSEAVTDSRMGKVEENLYYFRKSPIWGTGFQVSMDVQDAYKYKQISLFSAPIEKGVLPLMVLGETGTIGALIFLVFLLHFFTTCSKRQYPVTATLMICFLILNMSEANFFSPGGPGGGLWVILIVGGYLIDMIVKTERRMGEDFFMRMYQENVQRQMMTDQGSVERLS